MYKTKKKFSLKKKKIKKVEKLLIKKKKYINLDYIKTNLLSLSRYYQITTEIII